MYPAIQKEVKIIIKEIENSIKLVSWSFDAKIEIRLIAQPYQYLNYTIILPVPQLHHNTIST